MKPYILLLTLIWTTTAAFAGNFSMQDIAGKYKISHEGVPVIDIVTITRAGKVTLVERSPEGMLRCIGEATLSNSVINSQIVCENKASFNQIIDLRDVTNLDKFSAPVYSSLWDMEMEMNFERQ